MPGPCAHCGASCAPFGYRRRGVMADLPAHLRRMIFVCGAPACTARAKAWKRKADAELAFPGGRSRTGAAKPGPKSSPKALKTPPAQGALF